ncbi:MAG TPA: hypothetical protein DD730_10845 [Desulfosporosinus sp.]|jgi:methyl-accepting chemotaxis protein|nr:hypothetical protein [Desulfosporosinus sp.]
MRLLNNKNMTILLLASLVLLALGIADACKQEIITRSLVTMAEVGLALTILVVLLTWLFIQRVIINPLQNIMLGIRDAATAHLTAKVDIPETKEIQEINRMTNTNFQKIPDHITEPIMDDPVLSRIETPWFSGEEMLPKGLNKATFGQIVQFLGTTHRPISVEEVAEGVKMTRVTVRRYLEFLEQRGVLKSELKYGTVGRPVKLFIPL